MGASWELTCWISRPGLFLHVLPSLSIEQKGRMIIKTSAPPSAVKASGIVAPVKFKATLSLLSSRDISDVIGLSPVSAGLGSPS